MKSILFSVLLLIASNSCFATHIIGGEIYYDDIGNGNYIVTLEVYRDCFNGLAELDDPLNFTVFTSDNLEFGQFNFDLISATELPYISPGPCIIPPTDFCVQRGIYKDTIFLPANPGGYTIAYTRCCWANNITNLLNPGDNGITLTSYIPGSPSPNSNPRFLNYPPLILCNSVTLDFDHLATDPDGDSLVYSIVTPFSGADGNDPNPAPEPSPPFNLSQWQTGFSQTQPFGVNSSVTIDPQTGLLTFAPDLLGNFVMGVQVSEYRNGVLISSKTRTFGYRVVPCVIIEPVVVEIIGNLDQIEGCSQAAFVVTRNLADSTLTLNIEMAGTATNGDDYNFIPNQIIMPINTFSDTIDIISLHDSILEQTELVTIQIIIQNTCDPTDSDTTFASLNITNYVDLKISYIDSINICEQDASFFPVSVLVSDGLPPYTFDWDFNPSPNNDTLQVSNSKLAPQTNYFSVFVTDNCQKSIAADSLILFNQCPVAVPNIITPNGDLINDFFLIKNIEDYDQVELQICNRWGNLIYENLSYQNNWNGTDKNGDKLNDGVYFYTVIPHSEKYTYSDKKNKQYMLHGFFQIVGE